MSPKGRKEVHILEINDECKDAFQFRLYDAYTHIHDSQASVFSLNVSDDRSGIERSYSFHTASTEIFLGLGRLGMLDQTTLAIALYEEFERQRCVATMVFRVYFDGDPEDKFRSMMLVSMTESEDFVVFHCSALHK